MHRKARCEKESESLDGRQMDCTLLHLYMSIPVYTLSPVLSLNQTEFGLMSPRQAEGKRKRRKRSECSVTWMSDLVKVHYPITVIMLS